MANSTTHAALPYPVRGARYTLPIPYLNPNAEATAFDTEVSKDGGSYADCTEEITQLTGSDAGYITFTGAETSCDLLAVKAICVTSQKPTLAYLFPRKLPVITTGTATAGAAGTITLAASAVGLEGAIVRTTGGTGGGGTGGANNQARQIISVSGNVATVNENWEVNPDATTQYEILQTDEMRSVAGTVTVGTNNDKTGYSLSSAGVQAIWDALTSALSVTGSVGKLIVDNVNATISSRLATAGYTAPDNATISTISTNVTTLLNRIGSFTGSGVNTILGMFKALLSKTATTPSDVGGTFDPSTDSTEAIRDRGDAAWVTGSFSTITAADVWTYGTRVLTAGTNIVLAKGTGVTGFNDVSFAYIDGRTLPSAQYATAAEQTTQAGYLVVINDNTEEVHRRFFGKVTMDLTSIKIYADNGTDVLFTQTISDVGGVQTQGAAV